MAASYSGARWLKKGSHKQAQTVRTKLQLDVCTVMKTDFSYKHSIAGVIHVVGVIPCKQAQGIQKGIQSQ